MLFIVNQLLEFREIRTRGSTAIMRCTSRKAGCARSSSPSRWSSSCLVWGSAAAWARRSSISSTFRALGELLEQNWFRCTGRSAWRSPPRSRSPMCAQACCAACAICGLTLLGWLLPLVTGACHRVPRSRCRLVGVDAAVGARAALPRILLTAASAILVLLNAAYKDGDPEPTPRLPFSAGLGRLAGPVMLALALLAVMGDPACASASMAGPRSASSCAATAAMAVLYGAGYTWA